MSKDLRDYSHRIRRPYPDLYHLSFNGGLEGRWSPRPPDGDYDIMDPTGEYDEPNTPRISTSPTYEQCFQAVYANVKHLFNENNYPYLIFTIYKPAFKGNEHIVLPEDLSRHRLIHDAHVTQEHCILDEVAMMHVGKVKVFKPDLNDKVHYYAFGAKTKDYYGWLPGNVRVESLSLESSVLNRWKHW